LGRAWAGPRAISLRYASTAHDLGEWNQRFLEDIS
jgi:hypothetical protein